MPKGEVTETGGTIMPGMINCHAHLNWDGIHDLARQSMDDPEAHLAPSRPPATC